MKVKEEVENEETSPIEEGLSDLAAADEQADEAKGGTTKQTPKLFLN